MDYTNKPTDTQYMRFGSWVAGILDGYLECTDQELAMEIAIDHILLGAATFGIAVGPDRPIAEESK